MMSPDHVAHPYPTEQEKANIMAETGIELKQLTNWFVNNRKRYWKPRVEAGATAATITTAATAAAAAAGAVIPPPSSSYPPVAASLAHPGNREGPANDGTPSTGRESNVAAHDGRSDPPRHRDRPRRPADGGTDVVDGDRLDGLRRRPHTISEAGSGSSACDDSDNADDDDSYRSRSSSVSASCHPSDPPTPSSSSSIATSVMMPGGYRRHEEVDIYVLRPEEDHRRRHHRHHHLSSSSSTSASSPPLPLPTIRDLTIKASVSKERILASYKCPISYTIPYDIENDKRRVQSRRDGEVLRAKKHYLKLYLASVGVCASTTTGEEEDEEVVLDDDADASSADDGDVPYPSSTPPAPRVTPTKYDDLDIVASTSAAESVMTRSRSQIDDVPDRRRQANVDDGEGTRRKRARASPLPGGEDEWRDLCHSAGGAYCATLPSLEEAARMFGYASHPSSRE
jgi:hypothetical protein